MNILAIDTSCDETSVAVTNGRRVLSNVVYSQVLLHKKWGGVVPSIAKRAHEERIDFVIQKASKKFINKIDYIAVTQGPGLAIALEVGIAKAKELSLQYKKPLIAVNHMEGHLYSSFVQNSKGNPKRDFAFPILGFLVSGSHTELVLWKDHLDYEVIGETLDDAAGEALDKGARMLGLGYRAPVLETLARDVKNSDEFLFPRPMLRSDNLQFSFSGLKTSLLYLLRKMSDEEKAKKIKELASSYQEAVFDTLAFKLNKALKKTKCATVVAGGGVVVNQRFKTKMNMVVKENNAKIFFPPYKYLTGDNAAMIGVAAYYKALKKNFVKDFQKFERIPRLRL